MIFPLRPSRLLPGVVVLAILINGCASHRNPPEHFKFATQITDSGLKLFELTYPAPERRISRRPPANQQGRPPSPSSGISEKTLVAILETRLQQAKYCRQGYLLLGRHAGETTQRIRGECKEKASDADREQFPGSILRW